MTIENTSTDPLAPASPVDDPEIAEILDLNTGEILNVKEFIASQRYDAFIKLRGQIRERLGTEAPLFACAYCAVPVYVVCQHDGRRFSFRHRLEDGRCSARTRGQLSQDEINARKYHGQRESAAHKDIKALIERSLAADPTFHTIRQERQWRSVLDPRSRRQPDVQAVSSSLGRIAFEAQLSTTFLNVVVERRAFYRQEGALLVWVLGDFVGERRRLMIDDLLFSNNSNVFVVDEESTRVSEERNAFHLRCFFRCPVRNGITIVDQWKEQIVAFDSVTCNTKGQTAYYFDYTAEEERLQATIAADIAAEQAQKDNDLRNDFIALWKAPWSLTEADADLQELWAALVATLAIRGIEIPDSPDSNSCFRALINGVLSAEAGAPVGWNFDTLLQVAHRMFDGYKEHLLAFGFAVQHFKKEALLATQDKRGKWAIRKIEIKTALQDGEAAYYPNITWLPALTFLFPEIGDRVQKFDRRVEQAFSGRDRIKRDISPPAGLAL